VRDVRGKPVAPDKDEKVKGRATDSEESAGKRDDPAAHVAVCEDCMKTVTAHMGIAKSANGFKSEDQGGKSGNPGKGHDSTKASARQRH
jgi:hypothetical protein